MKIEGGREGVCCVTDVTPHCTMIFPVWNCHDVQHNQAVGLIINTTSISCRLILTRALLLGRQLNIILNKKNLGTLILKGLYGENSLMTGAVLDKFLAALMSTNDNMTI